jgi:hypothetical protein
MADNIHNFLVELACPNSICHPISLWCSNIQVNRPEARNFPVILNWVGICDSTISLSSIFLIGFLQHTEQGCNVVIIDIDDSCLLSLYRGNVWDFPRCRRNVNMDLYRVLQFYCSICLGSENEATTKDEAATNSDGNGRNCMLLYGRIIGSILPYPVRRIQAI